METEGRLAGFYVVEHDTGKVHLWTRVGGKTNCGRKVENMMFVRFITQADSFPGRSCSGSASAADTAAECRCGWSHDGPGAGAALSEHLYGDLSPAVRLAITKLGSG